MGDNPKFFTDILRAYFDLMIKQFPESREHYEAQYKIEKEKIALEVKARMKELFPEDIPPEA